MAPQAPAISPLGYALLALLRAGPMTGYRLRMVFETTPISVFSSSPGSIYPALKKLEKLGLLQTHSAAADSRSLMISPNGERALDAWLRKPVEVDDVAKDLATSLLRFAFLEYLGDPAASGAFLASFAAAARKHACELEAYLASDAGSALSLHGRLAVEHGLLSVRASARWAAHASHQLQNPPLAGGSS